MWSLGISDSGLSTSLSGARIDLSVEDNVIALALAECPPRPYEKLIKSDILGPSSLRSARSAASRSLPPPAIKVSPIEPSAAALRPSPNSIMKVSAIRPSAAKPTRGGTTGSDGDVVLEAPKREMKNLGLC